MDYIIKNVLVFEDVNQNQEAYHWATGELRDEYNPNLPAKPWSCVDETVCRKWLLCSVLDQTLTTRFQGRSKRQTRKVYRASNDAVFNAIVTMKFPAPQGATPIPCCNKRLEIERDASGRPVVENGKVKFSEVMDVDEFNRAVGVKPYTKVLEGIWGRIASYDTNITLADGSSKPIKAGDFVVGRNGEVTPVTSLTLYIESDREGNPARDPEREFNGLLERHYRPLNVMPKMVPEAGGQNPPASSDDNDKAKKEADEATKAIFGS